MSGIRTLLGAIRSLKLHLKMIKRISSERMCEDAYRQSMLECGVSIKQTAKIYVQDTNRFHAASNVFIGDYTVIHVTDDPKFSDGYRGSCLYIGEGTYIGEMNNIRAAGGVIKIGKKCLISQHVTIVASNHGTAKGSPIIDQPWDIQRINVEIEDDVWIGAGVTVLPGAIIRKGAAIGANSVVLKEIPEYAIAAGVPARIIGYRE